jgi:SnoaL-like domain
MNSASVSHVPFPLAAVIAGRSEPPSGEDAAAIQNLIQSYGYLVDNAQEAALAGIFTDDAEWNGTEFDYGVQVGSVAIAASLVRHFDPENPMMHLPGPAILSLVGPDEVAGAVWSMSTRWVDGATLPFKYFHYEDRYRRGLDGIWRIHRRHAHRRFRPPAS